MELVEMADILGYEVDALRGKSRQRPLVTARQIAMYVFRELTVQLPEHRTALRRRDHTTVIHAVEKIRDKWATSMEHERVTNLLQRLKS